jgi:G:T-mismatch repair DNA endonuclease (very short patch repair protein)
MRWGSDFDYIERIFPELRISFSHLAKSRCSSMAASGNCGRATLPATNVDYWAAKFDRNVRRDARNAAELRKLGWRCVRIWECETKDAKKLAGVLRRKVAAKTPRCD